MLRHRCPWCGEKFTYGNILMNFFVRSQETNCPYCNNAIIKHAKKRYVVFAILVMGLTMPFLESRATLALRRFDLLAANTVLFVLVVFLVLVILLYLRVPWKRDEKTKTISVTGTIHWKKGLWMLKRRVLNGEIFPACFLDAEGTPISTALCVALEKIHWTDTRHCTCQISLVLDEAPADELLCGANQFYLYHNYREIAKGSIQ